MTVDVITGDVTILSEGVRQATAVSSSLPTVPCAQPCWTPRPPAAPLAGVGGTPAIRTPAAACAVVCRRGLAGCGEEDFGVHPAVLDNNLQLAATAAAAAAAAAPTSTAAAAAGGAGAAQRGRAEAWGTFVPAALGAFLLPSPRDSTTSSLAAAARPAAAAAGRGGDGVEMVNSHVLQV